jgi:hypothetical protein
MAPRKIFTIVAPDESVTEIIEGFKQTGTLHVQHQITVAANHNVYLKPIQRTTKPPWQTVFIYEEVECLEEKPERTVVFPENGPYFLVSGLPHTVVAIKNPTGGQQSTAQGDIQESDL